MIDIEIDKGKPAKNELEVTLIGAGSNAGESIVVHLADNKWMIIDSCKSDGEVLPLYYLQKKEINLGDVIFVMCTHWHSDHVRGLSNVISACPNAKLILPAFFTQKKAYEVLFASSVTNQSPVAKELHACLNILKEREGALKKPMYLGPRDELKTILCDGVNVEVRSFSPSDYMKELYDKLLAYSTFKEMAETDMEPNMCSSVIDISTDNHLLSVLLGADLECNREKKEDLDCKSLCADCFALGWCNIITESDKFKERAKYNYIKAAHHSSVTGYCPELMDSKVDKERTVITTTVFENGAGVRLPKEDMLRLYLSKADNYYITAQQSKPVVVKDGKTEIEELKHNGVEKVKAVESQCGIISHRFDIRTGALASNALWGHARKVDEELIKNFA